MNLSETAFERDFRTAVRAFLRAELPTDLVSDVRGFKHLRRDQYVQWQRILVAQGWGAPGWPREYGGTGWNAMQRAIFDDECYRSGAPRQIPFGLSMIGPVLMKFGTAAQREKFLPRIIPMDDWWCQGYSEPGAGSDLASITMRARRDDREWILDGQKTWTTFAHYADWIFCLVRTSGVGRPQEGISFLLVDMRSPGVRVQSIRTLDLGADVNDVFFDEVRVPLDNLVGTENRGWAIAKFLLGHERTNIAGIGMCRRLMAGVKEFAHLRVKDGCPLIEDPSFRNRLVALEMEVLSHEWSLMRMVSLEQANRPMGVEPSMLKIRGSEIQQQLAQLLLESIGPYGLPFVPAALHTHFTGDTAGGEAANSVAPMYFDLRKVSIYGGTNEIQKNIIARAVLGL